MGQNYRFELFIFLLTKMLLKYGPKVLEEQCKAEQSTREEQK